MKDEGVKQEEGLMELLIDEEGREGGGGEMQSVCFRWGVGRGGGWSDYKGEPSGACCCFHIDVAVSAVRSKVLRS